MSSLPDENNLEYYVNSLEWDKCPICSLEFDDNSKIRTSVSKCLTEDHSSVDNWNGNLNAYEIDINFNWKRGMKKAIKILRENFKYSDIELDTTNLDEIITVRHPFESFNETLDEGNNENDDHLDNIEQDCLILKENDLDEEILLNCL